MKKLLIPIFLSLPFLATAKSHYNTFSEWQICQNETIEMIEANGGGDENAVDNMVYHLCGDEPMIKKADLVSGKTWWRDMRPRRYIERSDFTSEIKKVLNNDPALFKKLLVSANSFQLGDKSLMPQLNKEKFNLFAKPFIMGMGNYKDKEARSCIGMDAKTNAIAIGLATKVNGKYQVRNYTNQKGQALLKKPSWKTCSLWLERKY